jgi:hypothetical protein
LTAELELGLFRVVLAVGTAERLHGLDDGVEKRGELKLIGRGLLREFYGLLQSMDRLEDWHVPILNDGGCVDPIIGQSAAS